MDGSGFPRAPARQLPLTLTIIVYTLLVAVAALIYRVLALDPLDD
jgi:hypothetical protein